MKVGVGRDVRIDVRDDSHDVCVGVRHTKKNVAEIYWQKRMRGNEEQDEESTKLLVGK